MNSNNINSTADSSNTQATDDLSQPSPIRALAIAVKVEKGATATLGISGISSACTVHDPSIIGSTNENPITTLVSSPALTSPPRCKRSSQSLNTTPVNGSVAIVALSQSLITKTTTDTVVVHKTSLDKAIRKEKAGLAALILAARTSEPPPKRQNCNKSPD